MKITKEELGFNKNHGMIIAAVILAFAIYASPALGFDVKRIFIKDKNSFSLEPITYESVRSKVMADMGVSESPDYKKMQDQLALIDRGAIDTRVLGEAIGIGEIPSPSEMQLPEMLQEYPLNIISNNDLAKVAGFKQAVSEIENKHGLIDLMATLNTTDASVIKDRLPIWKQMLAELSRVPVPSSFAEEFRARFGFYYSMMKTGEIYAGLVDESELPLYLKAMMAFSSKMENNVIEE